MDLLDFIAKSEFGTGLPEAFDEQFDDRAHAVLRPCKSLYEDALEERREGAEGHRVAPGVSKEEDRQTEEVAKARGGDELGQDLAGGALRLPRVRVGGGLDALQKRLEALAVGGELPGDALLEGREVVVQPEFRRAAANGGTALWTEMQLFAPEAQLPQNSVERRGALLRRREVGEGVKPRVEDPPAPFVPGVQPTGPRVTLEDAYALPEVRQTDPGGQPRKTAAYDDDIGFSRVESQKVKG